MSYGFVAVNDNGKVIISDQIENLHFLGQATRGGNNSDFADFPNYTSNFDALDGRVIHYYTITCTGTPIVFIKPNDYSRWYGVIKQSVSGTTWSIDVIVSGTSTSNPPDLYCFVNADDAPASSENYGMQVFKSNGTTKTFDSRRQPLAITGGGNVIAPTDPTNGSGLPTHTTGHPWNTATNDHDFRCSNQYNQYNDTNINTTNTMFSCPSLAQAVYKRRMDGFKRSRSGYPLFQTQDHYSTAQWFGMYRSAFRLRTNYFDAGWAVYAAGYSFSSVFESGGWLGGGGGSYSSGTMPYDPKTINLQTNAYIIADSSRYN
jgi:hypothetical protein